ncbi:hypothetical protein HPB49_006814 [Dermacentor silvarum]|uniref:Uncharacterized protein n=1 Tax=Dermacentor silvarum TaxID=543639 RepID=A0ACB8CDS2_DERSI|nr:hypothetical protein HPB49_006814 [Dermacentor silvarum]
MADCDQPPIPDRSVEQKYLLRRNQQISPEVRVTYFLHLPLLPVMVACFRSRSVDMENMYRMDAATRRALLFMLLGSDSSDSDTSSKSSDDSTDTDSECDAAVCQRAFDVMFRLPANRPKVIEFVEDVVRRYSDDEVPYSPRHFRLSRAVAEQLIARFAASPACPSSNHGGVPAKSAETHVLTFIWYAANKTSMREVASRFDLSETSVHRILLRVADFLLTMGPSVVTFPSNMEKLSREFQKVSGIPGVVGCLDGSYIKIQCPDNKVSSTYCNRHHHLSLTLQAVCAYKRRFLDTCQGSSSKIHDSRIFKLSSLSKKLPKLCDNNAYHLLGDAAYPLRPYLLTPFRDYEALSKAHIDFNKFSATRVLIENSFSNLKKRFRQLIYLELRTVEWLNKFIIASCILHSLCIECGDLEPDEPDDDATPQDVLWHPQSCTDDLDETTEETLLRRLGELKRSKVLEAVLRKQ